MSKPAFHRSHSVFDRDVEERAAKMENVDFPKLWLQKMKNVFTMLDVKNKGYHSQDSYRDFSEAIIKHSEMSQEKADEMMSVIDDAFQKATARPDKKTTFEHFCKIRYIIISDPELWKDYQVFLSMVVKMVFNAIDTDKDGYISPDEWAVFYKCMNIFDRTVSDHSFAILDLNKDGLISVEEFLTAYFDFIHSQESGKYDSMFGPLPDAPVF